MGFLEIYEWRITIKREEGNTRTPQQRERMKKKKENGGIKDREGN